MTSNILDKILKPEYRLKLADYEHYIGEKESIGLDIIAQIYASKGNKHVSIALPE
jgi:hypothetical protein